ncbi:MAG: hypothetical protein D6731_15675, partial [Planctomycetota bacterium]
EAAPAREGEAAPAREGEAAPAREGEAAARRTPGGAEAEPRAPSPAGPGVAPAGASAASEARSAGEGPRTGVAPPATAEAGSLPLALLRFDSEYDGDLWAAAHLVDGRSGRGWCSSPEAKAPHRFVFGLRRPARVVAVSFDDACPEARGFEGIAARDFALYGSTAGPDGPFELLLEGRLGAGRNGQRFPLPRPARVRALELRLRSNHGHPELTELMEFRVHGEELQDTAGAALRLEGLRASRSKNGPATDAPFRPGERVWINARPVGLAASGEGTTHLEVDLQLVDAAGRPLLRRERVVNHAARPPRPPRRPYVALYLDLPSGFPPGRYAVRLLARDRVAERSAAGQVEFSVAE